MTINTTPVSWFEHTQVTNLQLSLNDITSWQITSWVTALIDPEDTRLYQKSSSMSAYRVEAVVTIPTPVSPNPATPAVISIVGGLNAGDTITVNGNDTSGGGSVAYPQVVYVASQGTSESAAQDLAGQISAEWGLIPTSVGGDDFDATVLINNVDSLEITAAVYVSSEPVIPNTVG